MENLVGLVLPPVIDLVNTRVPNQKVRFWVALAICAVVGTVLNYEHLAAGNVDMLAGSISLIFAEAQVVYHQFWQNSGARASLQKTIK